MHLHSEKQTALFSIYKEVLRHGKNDISAQEKTAFQGPWIQGKNEDRRRTQGPVCQKGKRKKSLNSIKT